MTKAIDHYFDLTDRVAIITGAAGLLGSGYARTLASAGAHVALIDVEGQAVLDLAVEIEAETGLETLGIRTDVSNQKSVRSMVAKIFD